jgi:hypothetical protein
MEKGRYRFIVTVYGSPVTTNDHKNPEISRSLASLLPDGDPKHLDAFMQAYAVEKAKIEAWKKGHSVYEQPLADGSIKLVIQVGGGA